MCAFFFFFFLRSFKREAFALYQTRHLTAGGGTERSPRLEERSISPKVFTLILTYSCILVSIESPRMDGGRDLISGFFVT